MSGRFSRTIYVGNLPADIRESEVEDLFYKYGRILDIELKIPPRPPCYCFVEFENARDAEDAIRGRDGYNFDGCRLRVELAHGGRGPSSSSDRRGGYGGGGGGGGGSGSGGGRFGVSRHSDYRVVVRGLPSSASWQDLKDHMRKAGDVCFAEVSRDSEGTYGLVDYTNYEDMKYAIRKLDDSEFRNPWTRTYIRFFFLFWLVCWYTIEFRLRNTRAVHQEAEVGVAVEAEAPGGEAGHWTDLLRDHHQHLLLNHPDPGQGQGHCQDQDHDRSRGLHPLARLGLAAPDFVSANLCGFREA
ncbi:hypothetical protein Pfo_027923 [Paulownia fortunei]|nr:hypothetical protein Pfo_027923 [Paulownia fortunei]